MSSIKVNCVNCDSKNSFEYEALKGLNFVKCQNCGYQFNLFAIYLSLYKTVPLCKKMVDVLVEYSYTRYVIEAPNLKEKEIVEQNLQNAHFQEMLEHILCDQILFGNCFVNIINQPVLMLQRLEPSELEYTIDWVQEPPFLNYQDKIVALKERNKPHTKYGAKDVVHFKGGLAGAEPIGDSILGFWFNTWYIMRDITNNFPLLDLQGKKYANLKEFRNFKELNVLGAAGIPPRLVFPWMTPPNATIAKMENNRFQHEIEHRRGEISRQMEEEYFPRILNRPYKHNDFPKLKWQ